MRTDYFVNRLIRKLGQAGRSLEAVLMKGAPPSTELVPIVLNVPIEHLPPWLRERDIAAALEKAAWQRLVGLWRHEPTAGQLLARRGVPDEVRSAAGRAMLAARGGKATAAKMRVQCFPNLAKAREALKRKRSDPA
jgi:hypothetical protein